MQIKRPQKTALSETTQAAAEDLALQGAEAWEASQQSRTE